MQRERRRSPARVLRAELLERRWLLAGQPIISEFLAANEDGLRDAAGRSADWIEILNRGDAAVDLAGWRLTDDAANLAKWTFPSRTLGAGEFLVVFASGDGVPDAAGNLHANFDLAQAGEYLALVRPDGTIATEFAPTYPPQHTDVAYGIEHQIADSALVGSGSAAKLLVPTAADDAQLGGTWTGGVPLDDGGWPSATLPVGFDDPPQPLPSLAPVTLQNATADYSQLDYGLTVFDTINGVLGGGDDGWGLYSGTRGRAATAAFETTTDVGYAGGTTLEFKLLFNSYADHNLGRFRLSVTTDNRNNFANGLANFGDVTANWTVLGGAALLSASSAGGATLSVQADGSLLVNDLNLASDTYTVRFRTALTGITGFRLEALQHASLPMSGPGTAFNANAVLSEIALAAGPAGTALVGEIVNYALGKPVIAAGEQWPGLPKENLTDGNPGTLTHNLVQSRDFSYIVDLGRVAALESIELVNRSDCCPERLSDYFVSLHELYDDGGLGPAVWSAHLRADGTNSGMAGVDVVTPGLDPAGRFAGRYIKVQNRDNGTDRYLQIAELRANAVNWARGTQVTASGPVWPGMTAAALVDGSLSTFAHDGDGVGPAGATPAFTIDLGRSLAFSRIELFNRNDGAVPERLSNYRVSVHPDAGGSLGAAAWTADVRTDGSNSGVGGVDVLGAELDPAGSFEGQWIRIQNLDAGVPRFLQIAEVRAFGLAGSSGYDAAIATDVAGPMKNVNASAYLRTTFSLVDPAAFDRLSLSLAADDGFVAYLNGVEVARGRAPAGTPAYNATATASHYAAVAESFALPVGLLAAGTNVLAIHGLNVAAGDRDLFVAPSLTARASTFGPDGYLRPPTPGAANGLSYAGLVADTAIDPDRGFFELPQDVHITTTTPGATIVYTLDGSVPSPTNGVQVPPPSEAAPPAATVHVATTTVLRAAAFKAGWLPTNVDTHTYLFLADVIRQPAAPLGWPTDWAGYGSDYEMDPDVVNDPAYQADLLAGLRSIPTLSIVLPGDDFLGPTQGIYTYPDNRGDAWEKAASLELIRPDGSTGFQVDAGLEIWGNGWRSHSATLKHAFKLSFKDQYGPRQLHYRLFPDAPVNDFDDLVLRAQGSRGWTDFRSGGLEIEATQYIHDSWARDTMLAMGQVEGHATYVHLYINGLYWGLYNPVERPSARFGARYFGGSAADYDAINRRFVTEAADGDLVAWRQLQAAAEADLTQPAAYAAIQQLVDVDNLIDYMLLNQYATNHDGPDSASNNMRAVRRRDPAGPFQFDVWDMEYTFWDPSENRNIDVDLLDTASHVYARLRTNDEFRLRYADRAYRHLFHGGPLSPEGAAAAWQARADEIYTAIVAESARWGDFRRPNQPYTRNVEWQAELDRLLTQYFPVRTAILLEQLRAGGLYTDLDAPQFNQHGGQVPAGFGLSMTAAAPIYYTLDGSDPRLPGGAIAPAALLYAGPVTVEANVRVRARAFDGSSWSALDDATFLVAAPPLRITEIMYHPAAPPPASPYVDEDFEFIELANVGAAPLAVGGATIAGGIAMTLPAATLAPGEHGVLVANAAAFAARYGAGPRVLGQYSGRLNNAGESLVLAGPLGEGILDFAYDDAWFPATDGGGPSLVVVDEAAPRDSWGLTASWRASSGAGGSPGTLDPTASPNPTVTNVLDAGPGSLRQAILDVLATAGQPHTIAFAIPGPGLHAIALASALPTLSEPVTIVVPAGTVVDVGGAGAFGFPDFASLAKTGAGTLVFGGDDGRIKGNSLTIGAGLLRFRDGAAGLLALHSLAVSPGATLDLNDSDLVVHATAAKRAVVLAEVTALLASGAANLTWTGPGINSSAAAGDPSLLTGLGVMLNDNGFGGAFYPAFSGEPVDANSVLVKYTYYGDADLSGTVDGTDYALTDNGFNAQLSGWFNGDFDYTGLVDGTDYALIDNAFNSQGAPLWSTSPAAADVPALPVPRAARATPGHDAPQQMALAAWGDDLLDALAASEIADGLLRPGRKR